MQSDLRRKVLLAIKAIRYRDAIIFQAPSVIGLAFTLPLPTQDMVVRISAFLLGCFLLMAHIFAFNDWSDYQTDSVSSGNLPNGTTKHLQRTEMLGLAVGLAVSGLFTMGVLSGRLFFLASLIVILSLTYSSPIPRFYGKGIPVVSSVLHFVTSIVIFLLGYGLFSPINSKALLIGTYFGLIITAGHLVQEIGDMDADQGANIKTNAVQFGPHCTFFVSFLLFTFSFVVMLELAISGLIPSILRVLVLLFPVHVLFTWKTHQGGLTPHNIRKFRGQYRILFAIVVVVMATVAAFSGP